MTEQAIQQNSFFAKTKDVRESKIETVIDEDSRIATLVGQDGWEALKERMQRQIESTRSSVQITEAAMGDMETYGFRCLTRDLIIQNYGGIIEMVEGTANFLREQRERKSHDTPASDTPKA